MGLAHRGRCDLVKPGAEQQGREPDRWQGSLRACAPGEVSVRLWRCGAMLSGYLARPA